MVWKENNWMKFNIKNKINLTRSIKFHYPIIGNISFFNPYLSFYTKTNISEKRLNNKFQIYRILSSTYNISKNCKIRDGWIVKHNNKGEKSIIKDKIFVKEIPLIPFKHVFLLTNSKETNPRLSFNNFIFNNNLFSYDNPAFVELYSTYITGNLVENNITPHFIKLYGNFSGIYKTFTYYENKESIENVPNGIFPKNTKFTDKNVDIAAVKIKKCPVMCIITEVAGNSLFDELKEKDYYIKRLKSYFFQILTALSLVQSKFNLIHNDLHTSNILCNNTSKKYLYYKGNDERKYKIPTFGKILKIIDWGRSRLTLKDKQDHKILDIKNNIFESDYPVMGQYFSSTLGKSSKGNIYNNYSFDITLFAFCILKAYDHQLDDEFIKYLKNICILSNNENLIEKYEDISFDCYIDISKYSNKGVPSVLLKDSIFNEFKIDTVDENQIYYSIE